MVVFYNTESTRKSIVFSRHVTLLTVCFHIKLIQYFFVYYLLLWLYLTRVCCDLIVVLIAVIIRRRLYTFVNFLRSILICFKCMFLAGVRVSNWYYCHGKYFSRIHNFWYGCWLELCANTYLELICSKLRTLIAYFTNLYNQKWFCVVLLDSPS